MNLAITNPVLITMGPGLFNFSFKIYDKRFISSLMFSGRPEVTLISSSRKGNLLGDAEIIFWDCHPSRLARIFRAFFFPVRLTCLMELQEVGMSCIVESSN